MKAFLFILSSFWPMLAFGKAGNLLATVSGLQSQKGTICFYLYDKADHFPGEFKKAKHKKCMPASNKPKADFSLPTGDYAMFIHHDENSNGELDKKYFVIPSEGMGSSNNPRGMGPPSFDEAKFTIKGKQNKINIELIYL